MWSETATQSISNDQINVNFFNKTYFSIVQPLWGEWSRGRWGDGEMREMREMRR
jgi:hypothetical protein